MENQTIRQIMNALRSGKTLYNGTEEISHWNGDTFFYRNRNWQGNIKTATARKYIHQILGEEYARIQMV